MRKEAEIGILFLALLLGLTLFHIRPVSAYDSYYYYEPNRSLPYQDDPYYTLHMIHYQLYRQQSYSYPVLAYPYPSVQILIVRPWSKEVTLKPREKLR